ncbi:MAG TPA: AMP-dependent synthetase/ligase [Gallionellaceae bacterium]|nr:AMP-dependent synthetase/ligase [Gallionellaceae bacterium]
MKESETAMDGHIITPEEAGTLHGLFLARVRRSPDHIAYRYYDPRRDHWVGLTWRQMHDQVARWQAALLRENLQAGDRVAIMLHNCPQWVMFDQAALSLGLVLVPLYVVDRPDNVAYIVNDAGVKVLLFAGEEQWQELHTVKDQMKTVQRFISLEAVARNADARLQWAEDWLPGGAELQPDRVRDPAQLATIMYTSGTTGKPKGVMLSHNNLLRNAYAAVSTFHGGIGGSDIALSFLPLSHAFERLAGYYMLVMSGSTVAYARSIPLLPEDFKIVRPTILLSVPRIYERVYNAIHAKLDEGPPFRHKLFTLAVDVGWDRFEYQQGRAGWRPKLLLWPLLKVLVADKVLDRMGGRLRVCISGSASLPPKVSRLFIALGLPLLQGYGMTETSPVATVNRIEHNVPSTVGPPLDGIEVRIGENNALLVRGHCVMMGYWNNPEATAAMIDKDGWLNTGDTATIAGNGYVTITGRLKEIIVMSNGEKVPPGDIEEAIMRDGLFDQVMVYGEARSTLVLLAVVNPEQWEALARAVGVRPDMPESLRDTRVEKEVLARVSEQMKSFPGYARVRRVLLMREPWTIENGLLTPTLKIKRAQVTQRFVNEISELYRGH